MKARGGVAQAGKGPVSLPGGSPPGEISIGTHWIGGWEGPRHDVSCPSWGSNDSSAVQACSPGNIRSGVFRLSILQYTSIAAYDEQRYPDLEINSYKYWKGKRFQLHSKSSAILAVPSSAVSTVHTDNSTEYTFFPCCSAVERKTTFIPFEKFSVSVYLKPSAAWKWVVMLAHYCSCKQLDSFLHRIPYLLTYLLTPWSSPYWEANRLSASQEIPRISWNPKVHYRIHKSPPPLPIPSQINLVYSSIPLPENPF